MSGLNDRENAFENKFALDESNLFKAEARACKFFGLWLAEKIGLSDDEAQTYAGNVIAANLEEPGFDDVVRFVKPDVEKANLDMSDNAILDKVEEFYITAQKQIKHGE